MLKEIIKNVIGMGCVFFTMYLIFAVSYVLQ